MRKNYIVLSILFIGLFFAQAASEALFAQFLVSATGATYRVFLRDKGAETLTDTVLREGTPLYAKTRALFTQRAIERRKKNLPPQTPTNQVLTLADAPLHVPYLDSLRNVGASILTQIRWRNYVLVTCSAVQIEQIRRFTFVRAVQPAVVRLRPFSDLQKITEQSTTAILQAHSMQAASEAALKAISPAEPNCGTLQYADSRRQLESVQIPRLQEIGLTGKGVVIGLVDTGFRWREQNSLRNITVLEERDFIQNDTMTANQQQGFAPDAVNQDEHGTEVLSVIAAFSPQNLIGSAYNASFVLAKTEDLRYERHIEEDNAAAAVEWLESRGVDIINASLGYTTFDQPDENYRYSEFDGRTTILSRAVNDAAARGVLCVVAAGNDGRKGFRTLSTPADADGALTVAAWSADSAAVRDFSSRGPRGDGALKPDVAAQGDSVYVAAPTGREFQVARGTSLAAPLIAGGAALILSAFPELRLSELRNLLISTASRGGKQDSISGFGLVNIVEALKKAGTALVPEIVSIPLYDLQRVGVSVLANSVSVQARLYARFRGEANFMEYTLKPYPPSSLYLTDIAFERFAGQSAEIYVVVESGSSRRRFPTEGTISLQPRIPSVPCGIPAQVLPLDKPDNVPEGVFPSVFTTDIGTANLLLTTPETGTVEYVIYSSFGSAIASGSAAVQPGISTIPVPVGNWSRGMYFLQVRYNAGVKMVKFIVR